MRFIADLHMHSRYSRATSRDMTPENLWKWSQLKGIMVLGTGDFTHPQWLSEVKEKLDSSGNGLFRLKKKYRPDDIPASCSSEMYFMLTAEISCRLQQERKIKKDTQHCFGA